MTTFSVCKTGYGNLLVGRSGRSFPALKCFRFEKRNTALATIVDEKYFADEYYPSHLKRRINLKPFSTCKDCGEDKTMEEAFF